MLLFGSASQVKGLGSSLASATKRLMAARKPTTTFGKSDGNPMRDSSVRFDPVALPKEANGQGRAAAMSRDRAPCFLNVLDVDRDPLDETNSFSSRLVFSAQPRPSDLPSIFRIRAQSYLLL